MNRTARTIAAAALVAATAPAALATEDDDAVVFQNGAGTALAWEFDESEIVFLPPLNSGNIDGYFFDDPGFFAADEDEPDEDLFILPANADVHVELVGTSSSAMRVFVPLETTFAPGNQMAPGDQFALGAGNVFDEHPWWYVDQNDPNFDINAIYTVDVKLVDLGASGLAESSTLTFQFAVPNPGTLSLLAIAPLAVRRRR